MGAEMFLTKQEKAICATARISAKEYLLGRKAALEDEAEEIKAAAEKAAATKTNRKKGAKNAGK